MNKDIAVAIGIGFLIGATVAVTAVNLPNIFKTGINIKTSQIIPSPTPVPVKANLTNLDFTIDLPKDGVISDENSVNISGLSQPNQTVILETASEQKTASADDTGKFSSKLNLSEGANTIYISVYDESGNSNSKTLTVYHTTEKL